MFSQFLLFSFLAVGVIVSTTKASEGQCVMFGICNTSENGENNSQSCVNYGSPQKLNEAQFSKLKDHCRDFSDNHGRELCCSSEQVDDIVDKLELLNRVKGANDSCLSNIKHIICEIYCGPRQFEFLTISETKDSIKGHKAVTKLDAYISSEFETRTIESCKDLEKTNGLCNINSAGNNKRRRRGIKFRATSGCDAGPDNFLGFLEDAVLNYPMSVKFWIVQKNSTPSFIIKYNEYGDFTNGSGAQVVPIDKSLPNTDFVNSNSTTGPETLVYTTATVTFGDTTVYPPITGVRSSLCKWAIDSWESEVKTIEKDDIFYHTKKIQLGDLPKVNKTSKLCRDNCPKSFEYSMINCTDVEHEGTADNGHCQLMTESLDIWIPSEECQRFCTNQTRGHILKYECEEVKPRCENCTSFCQVSSVDVVISTFNFRSSEE